MIIIDDYIKDKRLLNKIKYDENFFGPNGNFKWWGDWWNGEGWNEPKSTQQELVKHIWGIHCAYPDSFQVNGFEYWTGVYGDGHPNTDLGQHYDKDEKHWLETGGENGGEVLKPMMGTIYYPVEHSFDGGFLEIYSNGTDKDPERIDAKFNRLIIFDAGEHLHRVTQVSNGVRYAIAINLWAQPLKAALANEMTIE